jgi:hypothetical protein
LSRVIKTLALLWLVTEAPLSWAHDCGPSLALLGAGSESEPILRKALLTEMAQLYSEALQNRILMQAFEMRVQEMAAIEQQSENALYKEIEALAPSPEAQKALREEEEAVRREEQSRLLEGLRPYLDRIGRVHRKVIEDTLIRPGLVNPLTIGEVEFKFQGTHRFVVGNEGFWESDKGETKEVSLGMDDDFVIGQVPVTQFLYFLAALGKKHVRATPSHFKEGDGAVILHLDNQVYSLKPNHPVESLSIYEAQAHARRVSDLTGLAHRLPTELKWEFANRAGSKWEYHFGNDVTQLHRYAWFDANSQRKTQAVGQLLPNAFHLYDTHGNVAEWTSSKDDSKQVIRGGSFEQDAMSLRSAYRDGGLSGENGRGLGFRLWSQSAGNTPPSHTITLGDLPKPEAKPGTANRGGGR